MLFFAFESNLTNTIHSLVPRTFLQQILTFLPQAQALINKASPGDSYIFNDIKCKCPGDSAPRNIGQLYFTIK